MRIPITVCLACVFAMPAYSQNSMYVGLGAGTFDLAENFTDPLYGEVSDSATTYKFFGGFEVNDHFALEISYRETDDLVETGSSEFVQFGVVTGKLTQEFTLTTLSAVGQLPLSWGILLGGLGFYSSENDYDEEIMADCCGSLFDSGSISENGLAALIGIEWRFGRFGTRYGIRLEYEWWDIDQVDASSIGVGFSYGF